MLGSSKLQTIVLSSRLAEAEKFYGEVLGPKLKGKSHGASVCTPQKRWPRICRLL